MLQCGTCRRRGDLHLLKLQMASSHQGTQENCKSIAESDYNRESNIKLIKAGPIFVNVEPMGNKELRYYSAYYRYVSHLMRSKQIGCSQLVWGVEIHFVKALPGGYIGCHPLRYFDSGFEIA